MNPAPLRLGSHLFIFFFSRRFAALHQAYARLPPLWMSGDASGIAGTETVALAGCDISLNQSDPKHFGITARYRCGGAAHLKKKQNQNLVLR